MKKKVDESWKKSISKEKTESQPNTQENDSQTDSSSSSQTSKNQSTDSTFLELVTFLAQNCVACAEGTPDGSVPKNIDLANKMIAMLTSLEKKAQPSLSSEEKNYISKVLYQLRVLIVEKSKKDEPSSDTSTSQTGAN